MTVLPVELMQTLDRAVSSYNAGNLVEAENLCQQIIAEQSDYFDAVHFLAVIQSKLGKKNEALASYDRALAMRPANAEVLYNRGNILYELRRFTEALASYDRALGGAVLTAILTFLNRQKRV